MCIGLTLDNLQNYYRDPSTDFVPKVSVDPTVPWPTLETILDKTSPSSPYPTGLSREFSLGLAVTLASSVLQLHETGWLPEHWCKTCISFRHALDIEEPYIAARVNVPLHQSQTQLGPNPYLVGLGIILLELAEQLPFETWMRKSTIQELPPDNDNIRKAMLGDIWVQQALSRKIISRRYADVVQRCLWGCASRGQVGQTIDNSHLWHSVYFEILELLRDELARSSEYLELES
jgi:hypothetical protein